VLKVDINV
jgi:hypothetical protein